MLTIGRVTRPLPTVHISMASAELKFPFSSTSREEQPSGHRGEAYVIVESFTSRISGIVALVLTSWVAHIANCLMMDSI